MAEKKDRTPPADSVFGSILAKVGYYAFDDPVNGKSPQAQAHRLKRNSPKKEKRILEENK